MRVNRRHGEYPLARVKYEKWERSDARLDLVRLDRELALVAPRDLLLVRFEYWRFQGLERVTVWGPDLAFFSTAGRDPRFFNFNLKLGGPDLGRLCEKRDARFFLHKCDKSDFFSFRKLTFFNTFSFFGPDSRSPVLSVFPLSHTLKIVLYKHAE